MFSRFAQALYNAVEALAPPLPLQEDFVYHWKCITRYYTSRNASNKMPVQETRIPDHLMEMLAIVEQEEKELEPDSIGPCMEYIMEHKLLETMCILGTADSPVGMKRYMLMFATRLLKTMQQFLVPHVSIYVPIIMFIKLCGEVLAAPSEKEEIEFLEAVSDKLTENPHLVNCFMQTLEEKASNQSLQDGQETSNHVPANIKLAEGGGDSLVKSLLMLFTSPDNIISVRAGECLKTCCSLANDSMAFSVIQNTNIKDVLCNSVVSSYKCVPKKIKFTTDEQLIANSFEEHSVESTSQTMDTRKYLCYLQYLNFLDVIVQQAHPIISDALVEGFKSMFLDIVVYQDFATSTNCEENLFATSVITKSLQHLSSSKLITEIGLFLLGNNESFEVGGHSSHIIKDMVMDRCRDTETNISLSMASLQLLEELLQRPNQYVLHNLVLTYVESRGYYNHAASDDWFSFSDNETEGPEQDGELPSSPTNHTFAPPYIHRILDAFISLLPDSVKSAESEEDTDYDTYIREARVRFMKCLQHCENFDWPQEPTSREDMHIGLEDDSSSDSQPEADSCWKFYEGPFLGMIFDKIEHMLDLPYDMNLQVTSLVSRLALFAHPNLHEYLLNPLIPFSSGVRSLFSVLLKLSENIQSRIKDMKSFRQKLRLTRQAVLSETDEFEPFPETNILEVLIIVEEFCKELAAIAFVKYNAAA